MASITVKGAVVPLRQFRADRGLTQAAVAVLSGLTQREVSLIERGQVQPRPETIVKLAKALGIDAQRMKLIIATPDPNGRADP